QVNFADVARPVVSIVSPVAGQRVTNTTGQVTIKGKASDNADVANVQVQLNGGDWTDAVTANGWTDWTATLTPPAGTNWLRAYAVDATGNKSMTNAISFFYVVTSPLTLVTNGVGGISRSFAGNLL